MMFPVSKDVLPGRAAVLVTVTRYSYFSYSATRYFCHCSFHKDTILSNLDSSLEYRYFKNVDMVIEAVFEDIAVKHKVIKEVEQVNVTYAAMSLPPSF